MCALGRANEWGELRKVHESLRGPSKSVPLRIVPVVRPAGVCGRLAAQYSKRPEVLPFRDLAAGEAFAQDLLRRIPGRARSPVSPPSREEAPHDQGDEHEQPYPEQERDEDPGPKKTAAVTSGPRRTAAPIVPGLDEEEARLQDLRHGLHGPSSMGGRSDPPIPTSQPRVRG